MYQWWRGKLTTCKSGSFLLRVFLSWKLPVMCFPPTLGLRNLKFKWFVLWCANLTDYNCRKQKFAGLHVQYSVSHIYVFGSCVRKEETLESDIDFLAEFNDNASLFDQIGLQKGLPICWNAKLMWFHPLLWPIPISGRTSPKIWRLYDKLPPANQLYAENNWKNLWGNWLLPWRFHGLPCCNKMELQSHLS